MRQAVSVTRENAAASAQVSGVLLGHYDILRHRSRQLLAQNAVAATQRLLAGAAVFARIVGDARIDHDPVARSYRPDFGPDGIHDTRAIRAHDVGKAVFVRQPAHHEQVEVVERRGARRHADLVRAQGARTGRVGDVALL